MRPAAQPLTVATGLGAVVKDPMPGSQMSGSVSHPLRLQIPEQRRSLAAQPGLESPGMTDPQTFIGD